MKKNTAVEYLKKIINHCKKYNRSIEQLDIEIAKEMEKEQIKDAHLIGLITSMEMEATKQSEQYYNETFKNEEK